jgi:hypothetical protein
MIHKLANGPCTLEISAAIPSEGNFGPQVCFIGTDGTSVYVNDGPARRGLERLGLDIDTVIGQTVRFSQKKKDGKTFTDLDLAGEGTTVATPAPVAHLAVPVAPKAPVDLAALAVLYSECFAIAMATLGVKCEEAGVPYDAAALQSAAATLFIRAAR